MGNASRAPGGPFELPRQVSLKSKVLIRSLFTKGQSDSLAVGCVRVLYRTIPFCGSPFLVGFAVRRQLRAVDRNRIKRHMREAVRLRQARLSPPEGTLALMIVFRGAARLPGCSIRRDLANLLRRLQARLAS